MAKFHMICCRTKLRSAFVHLQPQTRDLISDSQPNFEIDKISHSYTYTYTYFVCSVCCAPRAYMRNIETKGKKPIIPYIIWNDIQNEDYKLRWRNDAVRAFHVLQWTTKPYPIRIGVNVKITMSRLLKVFQTQTMLIKQIIQFDKVQVTRSLLICFFFSFFIISNQNLCHQ